MYSRLNKLAQSGIKAYEKMENQRFLTAVRNSKIDKLENLKKSDAHTIARNIDATTESSEIKSEDHSDLTTLTTILKICRQSLVTKNTVAPTKLIDEAASRFKNKKYFHNFIEQAKHFVYSVPIQIKLNAQSKKVKELISSSKEMDKKYEQLIEANKELNIKMDALKLELENVKKEEQTVVVKLPILFGKGPTDEPKFNLETDKKGNDVDAKSVSRDELNTQIPDLKSIIANIDAKGIRNPASPHNLKLFSNNKPTLTQDKIVVEEVVQFVK